ncbi:prepilin-type N-terminal cleavage/methylation domain-containing protein [Deltaproteobacteria bacterium]|nr:prepilin-type N-terminal cleavage/methylation domain-containing protein [Deltaproteobacteria bacterium]
MQPKNRSNSRGFTLLEIIVAIAIFAAISSILYSSYIGTFRTIEYAESHSEIYRMARIALERITEDLESAYIPRGVKDLENEDPFLRTTGFFGDDAEIDGRSADNLKFASGEHLVFNEHYKGGKARIVYYVKEHEEEEGFILYRSDTSEFNDQPEEGTGGLALCGSLHSVNFAYHVENGELYDNWDSSVDPLKNKLPVMVSIELEFMNQSDPESPIKFITSVALPLARIEYDKRP